VARSQQPVRRPVPGCRCSTGFGFGTARPPQWQQACQSPSTWRMRSVA
jgi:hypothetical protein